jgi:hypothetical protein
MGWKEDILNKKKKAFKLEYYRNDEPPKIKYRSEINKLMRSLFKDDPLYSEEDLPDLIEKTFKEYGTSYEDLDILIKEGVQMGVSIELQLMVVKKVLSTPIV